MTCIPVRVAAAEGARDGSTIIPLARAPLGRDGRLGDFALDTSSSLLYGPKRSSGWGQPLDLRGPLGWRPVLAIVADGWRRVMTVTWAGGAGVPPAPGYLGDTGVVVDVAAATNLRGAEGPQAMIGSLGAGGAISYASLIAAAIVGDEDRRFELAALFRPGRTLPVWVAADLAALNVPGDIRCVVVMSADGETTLGAHRRRRVASEPAAPASCKIRSLDRMLPDGSVSAANGGWWLIDEPNISVRMTGARGDGVSDDLAAFNDAATLAAASGAAVTIPAGDYRLSATWTISRGVSIIGDGVEPLIGNSLSATVRGEGSWLLLDHASRGIDFAGSALAIAGARLVGLGTVRPEPQISSGTFAPTPRDFDISCDNADLDIEDVCILNPYNGVRIGNGRLTIRRMVGQPLKTGIQLENVLDVCRIENVHFWPFWNNGTPIRDWVRANGRALVIGRSDTAMIDCVFAIGYRHNILFDDLTAIGGGNSTQKAKISQCDFDLGGPLISIAAGQSGTNVVVSGCSSLMNSDTALVGLSSNVEVFGSNCSVDLVGGCRLEGATRHALHVSGANARVIHEHLRVGSWDQAAGGYEMFKAEGSGAIYSRVSPAILSGTENYAGTVWKWGSQTQKRGFGIADPQTMVHAYSASDAEITRTERGTAGNVVSSWLNTSGTIYAGLSGGTPGWAVKASDSNIGLTSLFKIRSDNGNVGIGHDAPNYKLQVVGNFSIRPGVTTVVDPVSIGDLTIEATANSQVKIKLRGSDNVIRSATLTLT